MIILLCILFVLAIISNIVSALSYIKSANRKAHYTMLEIKALRQVRDQIERLSKWKTQSVNRKFLRIIPQYLNIILVVVQLKKRDYKLLVIGLLNIHKEKEMDSDLVKELLCLFILILAFGLILYIIGIKWG